MIAPEVLGHEHARTVLARLLASGRLPHAFLFHGPEGIGKGRVALALAQALVCESPTAQGEACGTCLGCTKASHGNHPDLMITTRLPKKEKRGPGRGGEEPDEEDDGVPETGSGDLRSFIVVPQIRELTRHASFTPREAGRRVFIVDPADRMNAEAQNALLKTLEEPPGAAVLILVASRPHLLLPTVRSRCFQLGFGPMPPQDLARALAARGMPDGEARARAALAEGRPARAAALDLTRLAERRDALLDALEALATTPARAADIPAVAAALAGEDEADLLEGLDLAAALLSDVARHASGRGALLHGDAVDRIATLARALGAERAAAIVSLIDRTRGDLRLNVNKALALETILAAVAGGPTAA